MVEAKKGRRLTYPAAASTVFRFKHPRQAHPDFSWLSTLLEIELFLRLNQQQQAEQLVHASHTTPATNTSHKQERGTSASDTTAVEVDDRKNRFSGTHQRVETTPLMCRRLGRC